MKLSWSESLIYLAKCLIAYVLSIFKMKYALVSAFFDIDYFLQIDCHIVAAYFLYPDNASFAFCASLR